MNNRRGRRGGRRNYSRAPRHDANSVPISIKNLPPDPPTVSASFKRRINILMTRTTAAGTFTITTATIKALVEAQCFAGTTAFFRYQINAIKVWGKAGDGSSISVEDNRFGILSADSGNYARQPATGLYFPPPSRITNSSATSSDLFYIYSAPDAANFTAIINLTLWTIAKLDF